MAIYMIIGRPGHGKTNWTVAKLRKLLWRNWKWRRKTGKLRKIYVNFDLKEKHRKKWEEFVVRYKDPEELIHIEDADVFIDEVARYFEARDWEKLSPDLRTFLQEHDKVGCDIYANTQTPRSVDVAFRRLCERVWRITKIIGSRRPSPTRPPIRVIWGLCIVRELTQESFSKEFEDEKYETRWLGFIPWPFFWLGRINSDWYNTRQKILPGELPPMRRREQKCEFYGVEGHKCENHMRVIHI